MKKLFILSFALLALGITSCQDKKSAQDVETMERMDSLQRALNQKDSEINDMLGTLNEIQEGLRLITEAENKVAVLKNGEGTNRSQQIKENIQIISNQMKLNRELIEKLRKQLRESNIESQQLQTTIEALTQQLDTKEQELQKMREELDKKDIHIAELDETINNLNTNVSNLTEENTQKSQTISAQDKALNTAWYVFGTKKELKDQRILEDGKVMQSNFNKSYFTKVDIRVDKEIKLYSKSAKIMTNHPAGSYTLEQDANKQYVLRITNPDSFWGTSKYLVILVK